MINLRGITRVAMAVLAVLAVGATSARSQQGQPRGDQSSQREKILKMFDKDGDGQLSESEQQAMRERAGQRRQGAGAGPKGEPQEIAGGRVVSDLDFPSVDGRMIPAVLNMPKGEGPFPVVVTIHGGSGDRTRSYVRTLAAPGTSPTVEMLSAQPWAILSIDYRGGLFGMEEDDVVAGIRFAKTLDRIDPKRVGVLAGSHGAHLALRAAELMGDGFTCVAAGSPWLINPRVYLYGKLDEPPMSEFKPPAMENLLENRPRLLAGLERRMSKAEIDQLIAERSIHENADKIVIPVLFLTSRGDAQVPHIVVQPTIDRLRAAGRDITVYTATHVPHGFYWGREGGGARVGRGSKTSAELEEEAAARSSILKFFKRCFGEEVVP